MAGGGGWRGAGGGWRGGLAGGGVENKDMSNFNSKL